MSNLLSEIGYPGTGNSNSNSNSNTSTNNVNTSTAGSTQNEGSTNSNPFGIDFSQLSQMIKNMDEFDF